MSSRLIHGREPILKKSASSKKQKSNSLGIDYAGIDEAVAFMKAHGLQELAWEKAGAKLQLKMGGGGVIHHVPHVTAPVGEPAKGGAGSDLKKNQHQILSPFVGTFYRAPAPGADPYIREGQSIRPGDVLCIVEAMKLMNEIESEVAGKIVSILVEDGQPIEYGEPLFIYEK